MFGTRNLKGKDEVPQSVHHHQSKITGSSSSIQNYWTLLIVKISPRRQQIKKYRRVFIIKISPRRSFRFPTVPPPFRRRVGHLFIIRVGHSLNESWHMYHESWLLFTHKNLARARVCFRMSLTYACQEHSLDESWHMYHESWHIVDLTYSQTKFWR